VPQYFFDKKWNDVFFSDKVRTTNREGIHKADSTEKNPIPEYYIHFTLARFEMAVITHWNMITTNV